MWARGIIINLKVVIIRKVGHPRRKGARGAFRITNHVNQNGSKGVWINQSNIISRREEVGRTSGRLGRRALGEKGASFGYTKKEKKRRKKNRALTDPTRPTLLPSYAT